MRDIDQIVDGIIRGQRDWTPFVEVDKGMMHPEMARVVRTLAPWMQELKARVFVNNVYQVAVFPVPAAGHWPEMVHLSIKRRDQGAAHDWRDLQRIKNELVGPECEGVELYPAESRLVDSANQYHLFVIGKPGVAWPFGFTERFVSNTSEMGSVQRPFPRDATPADCETMAEHVERMRREGEREDVPMP